MLIPLDLYRMLGVPQQTSEELIEQAYQDRIAQLPRQEFSDGAIAVRNALLTIAYDVLRDPAQRHAYDQQWWGDPAPAADALPFSQPEFDCADAQLIGVLLILLDLGEYELVLKYGEPMVDPPTAVTDEADEVVDRADYLLSVTLAHWELSREYWQQQHYDLAAIASLKALARLQPENAFPDLQTTIRQDLYKLRPYRILALVTQSPGPPDAPPPPGERADDPQQNRQQGLDLLQAMIEDRGGIEGKGQDYSGLANDDFLKFILQLRPYLSIEEQAAIFLPESQRPSPVATYLAVHTLIARGIHRQAPDAIREAKLLILQSANCPDLTIENGVCRLLLGQTENLPPVGDMVQAVEAIAPTTANAVVSGDRQQDDDAVLVRFYQFTATWLTQEILPYFSGITPDSLSLEAYFSDASVQNQLENLAADGSSLPPVSTSAFSALTAPPTPATEIPMAPSSAAYRDDYPPNPAAGRRSRRQRRPFPDLNSVNLDLPQSASLPPVAIANGTSAAVMDHDYGETDPLTAASVPAEVPSSASRPSRRRKKRVKINPLRFGLFLLCLAGAIGGSTVWSLQRLSPLHSLDANPLVLSLSHASELIPDEATQNALLLSQTNFTQAVGQRVIQRWLDQKQLAFGKQHDAAALNTILLPSLLKQQQNRIQRDLAQNLYRQYDHQFNLLSYAVNPRDAAQATVTARVQEVTQAFSQATSTAIAPPSKDDLTVRYDLTRQQGTWKIAKIQVVTVH